MAKKNIVDREKRIRNKQKIRRRRDLKNRLHNLLCRYSVIANIVMGLYIYDPEIYTKLLIHLQEFYLILQGYL